MPHNTQKLAQQYATYFKVDITPGVKVIEDVIEETITRLEEYSSLIDMVHDESNVEKCNSFLSHREELQVLFEKIRKLEFMVARIKSDVYNVETLVVKAETEIGISTQGKIKNIFKPFFRRTNTLTPQRNVLAKFEPPDLFSTSDFF